MPSSADIPPDDVVLAARVREGDGAALEALFRWHAPALSAYAERLLGDTWTADSVVQDVFVRVWLGRRDLHVGVSPRALLFRAVRNRAFDLLKQQRAEDRWVLRAAVEPPIQPRNQLDQLEARELKAALRQAMAELPPRAREVIDLRVNEGLSHREIAEVMGISVKGVEGHRARALAHLRRALEPWRDGVHVPALDDPPGAA